MVEFGGWEMPVEYSGITDEHLAVRTRAGLFDVSHMGEIEIAGADALATVQWLTTNDASRLAVGQAQYSALTTAGGHVRRRHPRLPAGCRALHAGRQCRQHHQGLRMDRRPRQSPRRRHGRRQCELAVCADCGARARGAGRAAVADGDRSAGHQVLLVRDRRGGGRAGDGLAHRLYGRGRIRDLRAAGAGRAGLERAARRRTRRGPPPLRPGRARHAAPRSRDAAVWQRHGRPHERARGRTRAGLSAGRRTTSRAPTSCAGRRATASIASWCRSR